MDPNSSRDPTFGRFAFTVATIGLIVIVLGLTGIYYFFQSGGAVSKTSPLSGLFGKTNEQLGPNQIYLYYTKDGKQLVNTVSNAGSAGLSPTDKARRIIESLIEAKDAAGLKSPVPVGTTVKGVFVNNDLVIVNLSSELMSNLKGGLDAELLAVYSIVNSLMYNLEGIEGVQILIEGEKVQTLHGHIDISTPLIANTAITRTG